MRKIYLCIGLVLFALAVDGCLPGDVQLTEYRPKSKLEGEIVDVLIEYQDAKNRFDLERLMSLLHEKGEFSFQCGLMVSKTRLRELLPGFWAGIKSGKSAAFPMVHECVNGDYYKSGTLSNPEIEVHKDTAEATVLFTKGFSRVKQYFSMLREDNKWLITRTAWGES